MTERPGFRFRASGQDEAWNMPYVLSSGTNAENKGKGEILSRSGLDEPRCRSRFQNRLQRRAGRVAQDTGNKAECEDADLEWFHPLSCSRSGPGWREGSSGGRHRLGPAEGGGWRREVRTLVQIASRAKALPHPQALQMLLVEASHLRMEQIRR